MIIYKGSNNIRTQQQQLQQRVGVIYLLIALLRLVPPIYFFSICFTFVYL